MNLLVRHLLWVNPGDPQTGKQLSIRIQDGLVSEFGHNLEAASGETVVDASGFYGSPGWIDLKTTLGEPARPQNEGMESLAKAAAAGGFTEILVQPDTQPVIQSRESVQFFKEYRPANGVNFLVAAAATLDLKGQKMAELLTLERHGASAFATVHPVENAGFLTRLLQYASHTDKVLIHNPTDASLVLNGQMHEGVTSDTRGLAGIPSIAEEIIVKRDLVLQKYAQGKLHLSSLSAEGSVREIAEARSAGSPVTCDVAAHQLAFTHANLDQFDTLYKVMPPYRLEEDRKALIAALHSGTIDAVVSDHKPWHYDFKDVEFELAEFGISSLETTFSTLCTYGENLSASRMVELLSTGPSRILGRKKTLLETGIEARFTLFDLHSTWKPEIKNWQSLSYNNPFIGKELKGLVLGIITEKGFQVNSHFTPSS